MDPRGFPTTLPEFQQVFPAEPSCAAYLERLRWPDGFQCPKCGYQGEAWHAHARAASVIRCPNCRSDISLTAGTVMEKTRTPLCTWFWGAYLVTTQTPGMSALGFQRQLGIPRYETAFQMLHKLRAGMVRPARDTIGGDYPVEMDEVFIGGRTRGEGRGVHHKATVVGAVEVRQGREDDPKTASRREKHRRGVPLRGMTYAGRMRLRVIPRRTAQYAVRFAEESIAKGSHVKTDGWQGYDSLAGRGFNHEPLVMEGDPERIEEHLPMIHIVFSNLKTWLRGTHHGVSQTHLQAYLNEYTFRFNRRFYPMTAFNSVLGLAAHAVAPTYDELYGGRWEHPGN